MKAHDPCSHFVLPSRSGGELRTAQAGGRSELPPRLGGPEALVFGVGDEAPRQAPVRHAPHGGDHADFEFLGKVDQGVPEAEAFRIQDGPAVALGSEGGLQVRVGQHALPAYH